MERVQPDRPLSPDEAAEVIREATKIQQASGGAELRREDVLAMGKELGLSQEAIEQALAKRSRATKAEQKLKKEQKDLLRHVGSYVSTLAGLTLIDVFFGPGWWVHWVAAAWGIGLATHAVSVWTTRWFDRP